MNKTSFPLDFDTLVALTTAKVWSSSETKTIPYSQAAINLVRAAVESGVVDCQLPVGDEGHGVVYYWENQLDGIPGDLLEALGKQDPSLGPVVGHQSVFQALALHTLTDRYYDLEDFLSRWGASAPPAALGVDDPQKGAHVFSFLGKVAKDKLPCVATETWRNFIQALEERGINWKSPAYLLAPAFSVNFVEALVEAGVDTTAKVKVNGQVMPLWQAWSQKKDPQINEVLARHGVVGEEGQDLFVANKYLSDFEQFVVGHGTPSTQNRDKLWRHLTSRPDWHQVCDESGKSALFYAVQADPGILRYVFDELKSSDTQRKANAMAALKYHDPRGWGLWFYLLPQAKSNAVTGKLVDQLQSLIGEEATLNGKGWRLAALEDLPSAIRAWTLPGSEKVRATLGKDAGFDKKIWGLDVYRRGWQTPENADGEKLVQEALKIALENPKASQGLLNGVSSKFHWAQASETWHALVEIRHYFWLRPDCYPVLQVAIGNLTTSGQYFPIPAETFKRQAEKVLAGFESKNRQEKASAEKDLKVFENLMLKTNLGERLPEVEEAEPKPRLRL